MEYSDCGRRAAGHRRRVPSIGPVGRGKILDLDELRVPPISRRVANTLVTTQALRNAVAPIEPQIADLSAR
jgi:hypothetical protein